MRRAVIGSPLEDAVTITEQDLEGRGRRSGLGVAAQAALLRRLHEEGALTYKRVEPPDPVTGAPRQYVVDYGTGEVRLTGRMLGLWAAGFEAGLTARRRRRNR
jgi:hypothetical protein